MKPIVSYIGWSIALILLSVLIIEHGGVLPENNTLATLKAENAQLQQRVAQLGKTLAQHEKNGATTQISALEAIENVAQGEESSSIDANPQALLKDFFSNIGDEEENENPMWPTFEAFDGNNIEDAGLNITFDLQYESLFPELNLSPEREEMVRDILRTALRKNLDDVVANEPGTYRDVTYHKWETKQQLQEVLTPEEWAIYEEYEEALPEHTVKNSCKMQLRMGGAQLSDASFELVSEVLAEEMLSIEYAMDKTLPAAEDFLEESMQQQAQAFGNALARLKSTLEPKEYASVERFVQRQKDMLSKLPEMVEFVSESEEFDIDTATLRFDAP